MKAPMEGLPVCERCGLKAVRHELERQGIIIHFCDDCYWGVAEEEAPPSPEGVAGKVRSAERKTA